MQLFTLKRALLLLMTTAIYAQDYAQYGDYEENYQDYAETDGNNMYQKYAEHQERKTMGGGGGGGLVKSAAFGVAGWVLGGKIHSKRAVKKADKANQAEFKKLYLKYLQDVGQLQQDKAELQNYITTTTKQQLTDEFLEADLNSDQKVSRYEFEMHKKKYLEKHPEAAATFPRFDDFDPDQNGLITMKEHEQYYDNAWAGYGY
mmetsp:Transcript_18942/g.28057  ORF Transcript_18942/g.28057 Transcript_18942/m.28057 type:complete len:203 (+) Transcript_18942:130-738(+)|eukprot:CAMPEP_0194225282 /NCGR_PEP_ID=MMETSP0156-20130528/39287_1 /TAXON_ID=33649 /ORGANISM="Thalassionema nitzschioides, Strain L26-B" /LENGTH=202 /DNA_ID=CAMNT_0038957183 /DNA_START=93 /DNA_END=701 /DNA_ORIENTATION=+